ncbi:MAG: Holliday junction resolvase RuvX [Bdellovibrionales bacterium]|nr:Holliday junction resolvase RuvX [Bdellovibrionales bacterium]
MRYILGLDIGTRFVGVCLFDVSEQREVESYCYPRTDNQALSGVMELLGRFSETDIVVGLPFGSDGEPSKQGDDVLKFSRRLFRRVSNRIFVVDESFSTLETEEALGINSSHERQRRKKSGEVDIGSAVRIVERFRAGPPLYKSYPLEQFLSPDE